MFCPQRATARDMIYKMINRVSLPIQNCDIVYYLTDIITQKDPTQGAILRGNPHEWDDIPSSKCLSCSPKGVGLPIGDLTSQLFSNIFLNNLDWFVTNNLGFKHYGRYVDDFYLIDNDFQKLKSSKPKIAEMLSSIGLMLHPRKIRLQYVTKSIGFLGAVIYPYFRHCASRTVNKYLKYKQAYVNLIDANNNSANIDVKRCLSSMNSYIVYLQHFKCGHLGSYK